MYLSPVRVKTRLKLAGFKKIRAGPRSVSVVGGNGVKAVFTFDSRSGRSTLRNLRVSMAPPNYAVDTTEPCLGQREILELFPVLVTLGLE